MRNSCRIRNLRVSLRQRTVLPRWQNPPSPELKARWARFVAAVRKHEEGHQAHGMDAAREVQSTLNRQRANDCAQLERRIDALGAEIIARHAKRDVQHDAATNHGIRQGAVW
ncbi:MAG TPA: DUF922 domain-containing protein [Verrucomicrobiae bacterium]|nr:DUF922 domain-containing protein [Verrucomicrobiae bacterium]